MSGTVEQNGNTSRVENYLTQVNIANRRLLTQLVWYRQYILVLEAALREIGFCPGGVSKTWPEIDTIIRSALARAEAPETDSKRVDDQQQIAALTAALKRYAKHDFRCNALNSVASDSCDCRLSNVLSDAKTALDAHDRRETEE